ncbi:PREDICTED: tripartite motif-containing protein 16-like [Cyprinodon variegatus]|uniref:Tripartite motif-containing protein 16-like n=1 Tax=Cyprinodon variegatus TaxID=28743 RepID=A0A3Q2CFV8_CYPVA|nr:PREDICTED: tripartite motif-containing protein 16-like [Cyprinodon variegatus]
MAPGKLKLDEETISCSICLEPLKNPVTIPCGHSYCMNCIEDHWDTDGQKKTYSCPQCRKQFKRRPVLEKNFMLADLLEDLNMIGLQAAPADRCYAGPEDVACDVCTGRKMKAVKSCLVCFASYCENHLQPHYDAAPLQKHRLVDPSKHLQENICSSHDEVMKIFCRTDQQCICYHCLMDEHKGHETVPAAAERTEKQKELQERRQQIQQRIQDQEKDVKLLQQEVEAINGSADKEVEDSEKIFMDVVRFIQKRSSVMKQRIRFLQDTEVNRVKKFQKKLEQEITELKRKDAELEKLSITEDHTQFLQNYPSLSALSESTHSSSINYHPRNYIKEVTAIVSDLRYNMRFFLTDTEANLSAEATEVNAFVFRASLLKFSTQVTGDPNTANNKVLLLSPYTEAKYLKQEQRYPSHPDRFTYFTQLLSKEDLIDRHYWEVEWSGSGVSVAAAYKNIRRAGAEAECVFGYNPQSWMLSCTVNGYKFYHDRKEIAVPGPVSSRIGVFLDHGAGILSFYSVSETMTLLHRVQTTFTQPLYAGLRFFPSIGDAAEFIKPV